MDSINTSFWKTKKLSEMTDSEWESLCDRCGRCCLQKLEYEDTGEVDYTYVACVHLDIAECRCRIYDNRSDAPENCIQITPANVRNLKWLPETCAYRILSEGRQLESWHHLVSGDRETVHGAGISVRGKAIPGQYVHPDDLDGYSM